MVLRSRSHCGAVRFIAEFDLAGGTIKCNCRICAKLRMPEDGRRPRPGISDRDLAEG